jgi:hypothetical protein
MEEIVVGIDGVGMGRRSLEIVGLGSMEEVQKSGGKYFGVSREEGIMWRGIIFNLEIAGLGWMVICGSQFGGLWLGGLHLETVSGFGVACCNLFICDV